MRSKWITAVAAAAAVVLGLTGCAGGGASGSGADRGGTLTIASVVDNNTFDPAQVQLGHFTQYWMPVYDTLLVLNPESEPEPNLATEWSWNDDRTVLNLKLRDDVTFTDGEPFNAEAAKANIEHLKNGSGPFAYMVGSVERVEPVSDFELDLHLSEPDPGLVSALGLMGGVMASPVALKSPDIATKPVGSGPYVLDTSATTPGSQYVYTRNEDYWNAEAFPYDKVVIKPMNDLTARLNAIKSGQVNATLADAKSAGEAEGSGLTIRTTKVDWLGLIIADREGKQVPALGDVRVRQAINHAFDSEAILKSLWLGRGEVTNQVFNATSEAYDPELDGTYTYDLDKARKLMADAGYAGGFTVTMPETAAFAQQNPIIEQSLAKLNIQIKWVKVSPNSLIPELLSGKFPLFFMFLGSQSGWMDIQKNLLKTSPWNPSKAQDSELTKLVAQAQQAVGEEYETAMRAVNAWTVDNAWFAPWFRKDEVFLTDAKTEVAMQSQNVVPWIRDYAPAG